MRESCTVLPKQSHKDSIIAKVIIFYSPRLEGKTQTDEKGQRCAFHL